MQDLGRAVRVDVELKDGRALGTEGALVMRAPGIALDVDDLPIDGVNEGATPHRTIGADAGRHLGIFDSELLGSRDGRSEIDAGADQASEGRASGCANRQSEKVTPGNFHGSTSSLIGWIREVTKEPIDLPLAVVKGFSEAFGHRDRAHNMKFCVRN